MDIIKQVLSKKSVKVSVIIVLSILVAMVIYSLLHGRHTGIFFPWQGSFIVLPLRHWVVFVIATLGSVGILYFMFFRMYSIKNRCNRLLNRLFGRELSDSHEMYRYTKETCVYSIVKQDAPILFFIGLIFLMFVYSVRGVALATHDDIASYIGLRFSAVEDFLQVIIPRISARFRYDLLNLPRLLIMRAVYIGNNAFAYIAAFYVPILVTILFFSRIVSKRTNRYVGYAIVLLFFTFAQVNFDHNLFVSYPISFQIGFTYFLVALELLLRYYEKGKNRKHLIISAIFLFLSSFTYEAFVTYTVVLVVIMLFNNINIDGKKLALRSFLRDTWMHISLVLIYTLSYFIIQRTIFYDFHYDGAMIATYNFSLTAFFGTLFRLSTALFPMHDFFRFSHYTHFGFERASDIFSATNINSFLFSGGISSIIMALCAGFATIIILVKSRMLNTKHSLATLIVSLIACFVTSVPFALTPRHQSWVFHNRVHSGFTTSFHSYFWIICCLVVVTILVFHKLKLRKTFLVITGTIVFIVSLATNYTNSIMIRAHESNTIRYTMFDRMTSADYFLSIEDGAVIYIEGYTGVHHDMHRLSGFVMLKNEQEITFTRDVTVIEDNQADYFMWYDYGNEIIKIGRLVEGFLSDEIFMLPNREISSASFNAHLGSGVSVVYVDYSNQGAFAATASFPISIGADGTLVAADEICTRSIRVTQGSVISNKITNILWTGDDVMFHQTNNFLNTLQTGWSGIEDWGVWSEGYTAKLGFLVFAEDVSDIELTFGLRTFPNPTYLSVYVNDIFVEESVLPSGDGHTITVPLTYDVLAEASSIENIFDINVRVEIANPISPYALGLSGDTRELGVGLEWFSMSVNAGE